MVDPNERIHEWSDEELMGELNKLTGNEERDLEREAIRRVMQKLNTLTKKKTV